MLQHEHMLWITKIEKNKQLLAEVLESSNTAFEWKSVLHQVLQKHYLGEVEK